MRETYVIIPCGGEKATEATEARNLYTSSTFRMALEAAEASADEVTVLVLSAKHGLITLDTVVAPYDTKMGQPGSVTADEVAAQAQAHGIVWGAADVYAFLPSAYFKVLDEALRSDDVYAADVYEVNSGIGDQRGICASVRRSAIAA